MTSYFDTFRRFGLKMWGSFIVGTLAAAIPMVIIGLILVFALVAISLAGIAGAGGSLDPFSNPEAIFSTIFNPATMIIAILMILFFIFVSMLTSAFTSAGSTGVVSEAIQEGRATVSAYFRYGFRRLFPMLGLTIVLFLLAIPPIIPLVIGIFMFAAETGWGIALGIIFMLLTVLAYIVYGLIVMHAPTILIAEQKGVFESLSASYNAFRKKFGQVLLSAVILFGISIVGGIITLLLQWGISGANPFDISAEPHPIRSMLSSFLMVPVNAGLQVIVVFTLVFRYLHVINPKLPQGGSPEPVTVGPTGPYPASGTEVAPQPPHQEAETRSPEPPRNEP